MQSFLKTLVITMGLLIFAGMGLLIYGFVKTSSDPGWRLFGADKPAPAANVPAAGMPAAGVPALTGDIELNLPTGCEITGVRPAGHQIYVMTGPAGVCGQVLIVDPATKSVVGRISP